MYILLNQSLNILRGKTDHLMYNKRLLNQYFEQRCHFIFRVILLIIYNVNEFMNQGLKLDFSCQRVNYHYKSCTSI